MCQACWLSREVDDAVGSPARSWGQCRCLPHPALTWGLPLIRGGRLAAVRGTMGRIPSLLERRRLSSTWRKSQHVPARRVCLTETMVADVGTGFGGFALGGHAETG